MLPRHLCRGLVVLALSVFLNVSSVTAQDGSRPSSDEVQISLPEGDSGRLRVLRTHAVGAGYHALFVRTENGDRHRYHGPSIAYDYFVGRRWGFAVHGEAYFPAFGSFEGLENFSGQLFRRYADRHYALDLSVMPAYRTNLTETLELFVGAGVHVSTFALHGALYAPVEVIAMGAATTMRLHWSFHPLLSLNADFLLAFDPFDMLPHDNPATLVVPVAGSVGIGVRY